MCFEIVDKQYLKARVKRRKKQEGTINFLIRLLSELALYLYLNIFQISNFQFWQNDFQKAKKHNKNASIYMLPNTLIAELKSLSQHQ